MKTIDEILKEPGKLGDAARGFVEAAEKFAVLASRDDRVLAFLDTNPFTQPKSYKPTTREEIVLDGQQMGQHLAGDNMLAGVKLATKVLLLFGGI